MRLVAKVKLVVTAEQATAVRRTLEMANACCNWLSECAWDAQQFGQYGLHTLAYHDARAAFPELNSSVVIRCIAKVADAYKIDRLRRRTFAPHGALAFDKNTLRFIAGQQRVSLWALGGRLKLGFLAGEHQLRLLPSQHGESDLILHRGAFYLAAPCEVEPPTVADVDEWLGVDLGVAEIATTSDGDSFSGGTVKSVRHRHRRLRKKLQTKQTRSAKRRLRQLAGKERRFATDVNHVISKQIVAAAKRTHCGLKVEDLTHIRRRIKAGRKQRAVLHSWAFGQLRAFLTYKSALAGVPIQVVDPRNTSRECSACGHTAKANRKSQSKFRCLSCGFEDNADKNAARNISRRAPVNAPNATSCAALQHDLSCKPPALAGGR